MEYTCAVHSFQEGGCSFRYKEIKEKTSMRRKDVLGKLKSSAKITQKQTKSQNFTKIIFSDSKVFSNDFNKKKCII